MRTFLLINLILWLSTCQTAKLLEASEPKLLFGGGQLTEGPAVDEAGYLYFSDQPNDVIRRISPEGEVEIFLQPSGVTNGMAFDYQGRLLMCQSNEGNYPENPAAAGRRIARREADGSITVLADSYEGKPFIGPNDLCQDKQGRIYFTDPYYPESGVEKSQPVSGVYRIDLDGQVTRVVDDLQKPNGILITPDQQYFFISDRGTQQLHRYGLQADGSLSHLGVVFTFADRGIDGMAMDQRGLIYGAAGSGETTGVYVIDPESGKQLDFRQFPATAFNVCFGGEDGHMLYVCSGGSVYGMKTQNAGLVLPHKR
jgi:gluconolactonase